MLYRVLGGKKKIPILKMWVVGKRAKVGKKQSPFFNNTDELREKTCVVKMCGEVREFMQEEFEIEFMSIRGFEKKKQKILPEQLGGEKGGVACSMVFSEDLGNSSHLDVFDGSLCFTVWVELKPNIAKNWFFVLPNVETDRGEVIVIQIRHGLALTWDGRVICHCSSIPQPGENNHVYGIFFGAKRDKLNEK